MQIERELKTWGLRVVLLVIVCGVLSSFYFFLSLPAAHGLSGTYYLNTEWRGNPWEKSVHELDISENSQTLQEAWSVALQRRFSVEWQGYIEIAQSEEYTFFVKSTGGSWLWFDGKLVVNNGGKHDLREAQGSVVLREGIHKIKLRYNQYGGEAKLSVSYGYTKGPKLTKLSIRQLKKARFPNYIINRLKPLKWKRFDTEEDLLMSLAEQIELDEIQEYQAQIFESAGVRSILSSSKLLPSWFNMFRVWVASVDKRILVLLFVIFLFVSLEEMLTDKKLGNKKRIGIEVTIVIILFSLAVGMGNSYTQAFTNSGYVAKFYQRWFGPAVMVACGQGYINPDISQLPALYEFLQVKRESFTCNELPLSLKSQELNLFQRGHRYLISTVGILWAVSGIGWNHLSFLHGILFGLTCTLCYGIFRLGVRRPLAIFLTVMLIVSDLHLRYLPYLRDYAKAPFILAIIFIIGCLMKFPVKRNVILGLSVAAGMVVGIGIGFRPDVFITAVPFVAVLFCFLPGGIRANLKLKTLAFALFIGCFLLTDWPLLVLYSRSGGTPYWHIILMGLMSPSDSLLNIKPAIYSWGYIPSDSFVWTLINGYVTQILISPGGFQEYGIQYNQVTAQYVFELIKHFPADMLTRWYATIIKTLDTPFFSSGPTFDALTFPRENLFFYLKQFSVWRANVLHFFSGTAGYIVSSALVLITVKTWWRGMLLVGGIIYFAGYPAIRFNERHIFHLEFIVWLAGGIVLQQIAHWAVMLLNSHRDNGFKNREARWYYWRLPVLRIIAFMGVFVIILWGPLLGLRAYQQAHVPSLLERYSSAAREELEITRQLLGDGRVLLKSEEYFSTNNDNDMDILQTECIVVEFFSGPACPVSSANSIFRYIAEDRITDFSESIAVNLAGEGVGSTLVFFPVFSGKYRYPYGAYEKYGKREKYFDYVFTGVELSEKEISCVQGIYRVKDMSRFPLLLYLTLSSEWRQEKLYQSFY